MKRSEIDDIIADVERFLDSRQFRLPPFAYWAPEEWARRRRSVQEIVKRGLGWDVTDFGFGDYRNHGLCLFTLRNGDAQALPSGRGKLYAEKVLVVDVDQVTPFHTHWIKTEDIINRGGGDLVIQLCNATPEGELDASDVVVSVDAMQRTIPAGETVTLSAGESITLTPGMYHSLWAVRGRVLVGEVSLVNDDQTDNRFLEPVARFPHIEEDQAPLHLLVSDYQKYVGG